MHFNEKKIQDMFFGLEDLEDQKDGEMWSDPLMVFNLVVYVILKFIFIVLSISCPIPNGIFAPVFSFGAGVGRLYGHILRRIGNYFGMRLIHSMIHLC